MQNLRILFISILLCSFSSSLISANEDNNYRFQDTLNLKIDETVRLSLASDNLYNFSNGDSIDKMLALFNQDILKIEYPDIENSYVKIYFHKGTNGSSTIKFEDVTESDKQYLVLQNGETFSPMPVELVMDIDKSNRISIFIPVITYLEDLQDYNFGKLVSDVLEKAKAEDPSMKRKQLTLNWVFDETLPGREYHEMIFNPLSNDMLVLSGSVAASLVRNRLVPSIEARIGVIVGKKKYQQHMINAEVSMMYIFNKDPEGDYSTDLNTFIGMSYYYNPSKNPDKPRWFGVGLSYLAWQNGSFFKENTWRLTVGARFSKHFTVLPELYIGDNFNEIMPGLRMQVSF